MDLELSTEIRDGVTIITVKGGLDVYTAGEFRECLAAAREHAAVMAIDLNAADVMDSTSLGVLIGNLRQLRARGGQCVIICTAPRVLRCFTVTGLAKVFGICADAGEAVAALAAKVTS
jgi:anti-sigma B factor antagonist